MHTLYSILCMKDRQVHYIHVSDTMSIITRMGNACTLQYCIGGNWEQWWSLWSEHTQVSVGHQAWGTYLPEAKDFGGRLSFHSPSTHDVVYVGKRRSTGLLFLLYSIGYLTTRDASITWTSLSDKQDEHTKRQFVNRTNPSWNLVIFPKSIS